MNLMSRIVLLVILYNQHVNGDHEVFTFKVRMPNVTSTKSDALLCHAVKLHTNKEAYILKYEPKASQTVAHHMMLYGCNEPSSNLPYWPCGEEDKYGYRHKTCKHGQARIIYAWALDGQPRTLPHGVGFRVGGSTGIKYLIVGMHYKKKFRPDQTDDSGYELQMTYNKQPLQIGYLILGTVGYIPPMTKEFHADSGCDYSDKEVIYPLAYRTHSHNLGVVTSAYRLRNGKFTEIGRMSPQLPETFYDVTTPKMDIRKDDVLIARCTMSSQRHFVTKIAPTNKDEMCNFYIMYYTSRQQDILDDRLCFRNHNTFHLKNYIPTLPANISSIEGLPKFERIDPFATASG